MNRPRRHRYPNAVHSQGGGGRGNFGQTNTRQAPAPKAKDAREGRACPPLWRGAVHLLSTLAVMALACAPAAAAPWVRSFVVTTYEPAFLYGGPAGTADAPGSDCPGGSVPDNDYARLLSTGWRSLADIAELVRPPVPSIEPYRLLAPALHFRGFRPGIDTYLNPFAAPDPGLAQVSGRVAEGFDLDGNAQTGGFVSADGARGLDNGLYRALGCLSAFRGPQAPLSARANERLRDGLQTILIRLSGNASPARDDAVTVEIGTSPDPLVRNTAGQVLADYSYRLAAQPAKLTGRIRDGVLTTLPLAELKAPDFAWSQSNRGAVLFRQGRLSLRLAPDGGATGLVGGYRDWRELYARMAFNVAIEGPFLEIPYRENLIAIYYALARNADADPDARGRNRAISTAYRLRAVPAFAVSSHAPDAPPPEPPSRRIEQERADFARAAASRRIALQTGASP